MYDGTRPCSFERRIYLIVRVITEYFFVFHCDWYENRIRQGLVDYHFFYSYSFSRENLLQTNSIYLSKSLHKVWICQRNKSIFLRR